MGEELDREARKAAKKAKKAKRRQKESSDDASNRKCKKVKLDMKKSDEIDEKTTTIINENNQSHTTTEIETKSTTNESYEQGVNYTVSIALPGSIIANAQSPELRTYLAGQIARAAAVFAIDEVIIFSETGHVQKTNEEFNGARRADPNLFLARILQYLETPQYLRKALFPVHKDLQYAGLLNPLDAPHHMRISEDCEYREGVTTNMPSKTGTWVNVGLKNFLHIEQKLQSGVRVTVQIDDHIGSATSRPPRRKLKGKAVAPAKPRQTTGIYWGYTTRLCERLGDVIKECPYKEGYDLTVGTSERGQDMCNEDFKLPPFKHLLLVFGGVGGLEDALLGDERLNVARPDQLFQMYVNTCPKQGSRTIRTEEAIPITLAALQRHVNSNFVMD